MGRTSLAINDLLLKFWTNRMPWRRSAWSRVRTCGQSKMGIGQMEGKWVEGRGGGARIWETEEDKNKGLLGEQR